MFKAERFFNAHNTNKVIQWFVLQEKYKQSTKQPLCNISSAITSSYCYLYRLRAVLNIHLSSLLLDYHGIQAIGA